jgi:PPM family protein phosphatase
MNEAMPVKTGQSSLASRVALSGMADHPVVNLALYAQTDVGKVRTGNEDNFLILDLTTGRSWTAHEAEQAELLTYAQGYYGSLLAVSDGMGGALAGEVASRMAVDTVRDRMLQLQAHQKYSQLAIPERMRLSIEEANTSINNESLANPNHKGLGATFTAVATRGEEVYFAQVGDSRAYLIRDGKITRITKDQSLVQQLIDAGQITEEEAETHSYRNVILQALGAHNNIAVEVNSLSLKQLDTLVLCSDGLSGKIHSEEIATIVNDAPDLKSACQGLIDLANWRGGEDNITVVIAQFSGEGLTHADHETIEPEGLARLPDTPTEVDLEGGPSTEPLGAGMHEIEDPPTERLPPPKPPPLNPTAAAPQQTPVSSKTPEERPITSVWNVADIAAMKVEPELPQPSVPEAVPEVVPQTSQVERNPARASNAVLGGLIILGLAVVGLVGAWYWGQQAKEKTTRQITEQRVRKEKEEQKLTRIVGLHDRMIELHRNLDEAATRPTLKEHSERLAERLKTLNQRLDEVNKLPAEQLPIALQDCEAIEKDLEILESEVKSLLGRTPLRFTSQQSIEI